MSRSTRGPTASLGPPPTLFCSFDSRGGLVVDYPHSTRAKKYYLVLMVGNAGAMPQAKGLDGEEGSDEEAEVQVRGGPAWGRVAAKPSRPALSSGGGPEEGQAEAGRQGVAQGMGGAQEGPDAAEGLREHPHRFEVHGPQALGDQVLAAAL